MEIHRTKNGIVITPYSRGQSHLLERITSTYDNVYHKKIECAGFYMDNYKGKPAFLSHYQEKPFLAQEFPDYTIIDDPIIPPANMLNFTMAKGFELRPVQQSIRNEVILDAHKNREWFIHLQTAQGKTVIGTHITKDFGYKTFIFCFSRDILNQWVTCFRQKTQINPKRILNFTGSNMVNKILTGEIDPDNYDVFLATHGLMTSFTKSGPYKLTELMTKIGVGLAIFDEAHRTLASTIKISALCNFKYSLYLSADYAQSDRRREKMFYRFFRKAVLLQPDEEEEVSLRYTDIIVVDYDTRPSTIEQMSIKNKYGYDRNRYMKYQFKKGIVFDVLYKLIDTLYAPAETQKYRMLILFSNIDHVDQMTEALSKRYKSTRVVGRFHGGCTDEEKAQTVEHADIIVSTYASFGTGKDVERFKYVIGMNQSDKIEDNQAAGRARPLPDGSHVKYFMVVDSGFKYCKYKLQQRLDYLVKTKAANPPFKWKIFN